MPKGQEYSAEVKAIHVEAIDFIEKENKCSNDFVEAYNRSHPCSSRHL